MLRLLVEGFQPLVLLGLRWEEVGFPLAICAILYFMLALGLSYTSSQYGLAIDTVQAFELVLPNGTITTVTADNEDLFFGLKVSIGFQIDFCATNLFYA